MEIATRWAAAICFESFAWILKHLLQSPQNLSCVKHTRRDGWRLPAVGKMKPLTMEAYHSHLQAGIRLKGSLRREAKTCMSGHRFVCKQRVERVTPYICSVGQLMLKMRCVQFTNLLQVFFFVCFVSEVHRFIVHSSKHLQITIVFTQLSDSILEFHSHWCLVFPSLYKTRTKLPRTQTPGFTFTTLSNQNNASKWLFFFLLVLNTIGLG